MITEENFEQILHGMPDYIVETARKYPAYLCYRSTECAAFHYVIGTYYRPQADVNRVSVILIHGKDSTLPGTKVFGCDPEQLVRCGCGKWEWPSDEQVAERYNEIEHEGVKRANNIQNVPLTIYDRKPKPIEFSHQGTILPETFDPDEVLKLYTDAVDKGTRLYWFKQLAQWLALGGREPEWPDSELRDRFCSTN